MMSSLYTSVRSSNRVLFFAGPRRAVLYIYILLMESTLLLVTLFSRSLKSRGLDLLTHSMESIINVYLTDMSSKNWISIQEVGDESVLIKQIECENSKDGGCL